MTFIKIAWRNIVRNYRRSIITLLAIGVGISGVIFLVAFFDGMSSQMVDNSTRLFSGDIQIHTKGFYDDPTLSKRMRYQEADNIKKIIQNSPYIESYTKRVESFGLLSTTEQSIGGLVIGINPAREKSVTTLDKSVIEGRFLNSGDSHKIVLGSKVVEKLNLHLGDTVVILTQGADGSIGAAKFELTGIFRTGMDDMDAYAALIPIKDAQELFALGEDITGFTIKLKDRNQVSDATAKLQSLSPFSMEILPWQKLLPTVVGTVKLMDMFDNFIMVIVFIVIGIGILNTISMSVVERTKEFGMMMALGTEGKQILQVILYESLMLGGLGFVLGLILGSLITGYFMLNGLDLSSVSEGIQVMPGLTTMLYPTLEFSHILTLFLWVLVITFIASLFPAIRAMSLEPVVAIRGLVTSGNGHRMIGLWATLSKRLFKSRDVFSHIAFRNITRNFNRSIITLAAISLGLTSIIFVYSLIEGFYGKMIDNATRYMVGDMQLTKTDFYTRLLPSDTVQDYSQIKEFLANEKSVRAFSPRVEGTALLSTPETSINITFLGIDPDGEKEIAGFDRVAKEGEYLNNSDKNNILLGSKVAEKLKVTVGDKVVMMTQDAYGAMSSEAFRVKGIIHTNIESFDGTLVLIPLKSAQSLLSINGVSSIFIKVHDRGKINQLAEKFNKSIEGSGNHFSTWKERMPLIVQMLSMDRISMYIMLFVIYMIVLLGVMNTILIGVMERTREFGIMMALGTRRTHIIRVVMQELLFLGIIGIVIGNILATCFVKFTERTGIDLTYFVPGISLEKFPAVEPVMYPNLTIDALLIPSVIIFILSLSIGWYPAWKAASLDPAQALHHS